MLQQIVLRTPLYVWAILAFLVFRGIVASRDRDVTVTKLAIIPVVMLVLSLQDIVAKFGDHALAPIFGAWAAWAAWAAGTLAVALLRWTFGSAHLGAGTAPGSVRIRGSWAPLVAMLAVFMIKYLASVALAIQPGLAGNTAFVVTVCAMFGACNGYFLGQLAREASLARRLLRAPPPGRAVPAR